MSIDVVRISEDEVDRILLIEEGHFHDVKSKRVAPAKLSGTVSAFANADGGELYIGIEEDKINNKKCWSGFKNAEEANAHMHLFDQLFPLGDGFYYTFLESDCVEGLVLKFDILKSLSISYASNKIPYVRRGAGKLPQRTEEQLSRLRLNKGLSSFEDETVNVDLSVIENSLTTIAFMVEIIPDSEPEAWIRKQQLVYNEKPKVSAILLFADDPENIIRYATIKICYYNTVEEEGSRETLTKGPVTVEGNLYKQIYDAVDKTIEIVESIPILSETGLEKISYPKETLHEITTNAVIHRDYSVNDSVHVKIFNNRIEVFSPGTLPGHVTSKNILKTRFARNSTIVNLINKFPNPPNKNIGEGLNTAFAAMRKLNLRIPKITQDESNNCVTVVIKHEKLAGHEEMILDYLENHSEINNTTARELCYIGSENVVKAIFIKLMEANQIEKIPERRGNATAYRKYTGRADSPPSLVLFRDDGM